MGLRRLLISFLRYTEVGSTLVVDAVREATSSKEVDLTRRLYVDGVTYLLRGLPTDLSPDEQLRVQAALPPQLADEQNPGDMKPAHASATRQIVARLTSYLVLLIGTFMECLQRLCQDFYRFERTHRISKLTVSYNRKRTSPLEVLSHG